MQSVLGIHALKVVAAGDGVALLLGALLEAVLDGALAAGGGLGEGGGATEGTSGGVVAEADNADVCSAADSGIASHASGHLDLDVEVGVCGETETSDEAGDVVGDVGSLEGRHLGASRGAVDHGLEGTGAVLVDLAVGDGHGAVVGGGGEAGGSALAGGGGDVDLLGLGRLLACGIATTSSTTTAAAAEEAAEQVAELTLVVGAGAAATSASAGATDVGRDVVLDTRGALSTVVGRGTSAAHEVCNHDTGVDGAVALGSAERATLARRDVGVTDDGGIGLRTAAVAGAVTRSAIGHWSWEMLSALSCRRKW